jgi:hypothetical protein
MHAHFFIVSVHVGGYDWINVGCFVKWGCIIAFFGFYRHKNGVIYGTYANMCRNGVLMFLY